MTALADDRSLDQVGAQLPSIVQYGVDAGVCLYTGAFVAPISATGYLTTGGGVALTGPVAGVATHRADNSAAGASDGDISVNLAQGLFKRANSGTSALSQADFMQPCYAEDDQTVRKASGATYPLAGLFYGLDADGDALVLVSAAINYGLSDTDVTSVETRLSTEEDTRSVADSSLTVLLASADSSLKVYTSTADSSLTVLVSSADSSLKVYASTADSSLTIADSSLTVALSSADSSLKVIQSTGDSSLTIVTSSVETRLSTEESTRSVADSSLTVLLSSADSSLDVRVDKFATRGLAINLNAFREVTAGGDVGNLAAHGGILASDSSPALQAVTNETEEISWVAGNVDMIATTLSLPLDLDDTKDVTVRLWVNSGAGGPDAAHIDINTSWDAGVQVADVASDGTPGAAIHAITATIGNADIPATPGFLTIQLAPQAHATDQVAIHGIRIEYTSTSA